MTLPSSIPTLLGAVAVFSTSALVAADAILAYERVTTAPSSTGVIAIVAAAVEAAVLFNLSAHLFYHMRRRTAAASSEKRPLPQHQSPRRSLWFFLSMLLCTVAAAVSVAALVSLGKSAPSATETIFGSSTVPFLAGASVTLGIGFAFQLLFLTARFVVARSSVSSESGTVFLETGRSVGGAASGLSNRPNSNGSNNSRNNNLNNSSNNASRGMPAAARVKSIPYSQTSTPKSERKEKKALSILSRGNSYTDAVNIEPPRTPPSSSGGRSRTDTVSSIRSTLSQVIRPITSKTRLISPSSGGASGASSQRSSAWRPASLAGSNTSPASTFTAREREARPSIEDFDSWDTSAVDPQSRQTVLETSASPSAVAGRFLETIPASPTTSRSPSPGTPLDLEPPRSRQRRRRSRSYSPATSMRSLNDGTRMRSHSHSQSPPPNEAHIHPLFRSDSPTPPPAVSSAGTVVTAAPNGGQVLAADAQSLRSRMRSGSMPAVPSPLSRQGSFDDFGLRRGVALAERPHTGGGSSPRQEPDIPDIPSIPSAVAARGETHEIHDEDEDEADRRSRADSGAERKMTPPIPEWILSAGARTSLSGYQSRKVRVQDGAP